MKNEKRKVAEKGKMGRGRYRARVQRRKIGPDPHFSFCIFHFSF
jgi:hypothetical protein